MVEVLFTAYFKASPIRMSIVHTESLSRFFITSDSADNKACVFFYWLIDYELIKYQQI